MIDRVTDRELIRKACALAKRMRHEISAAGLQLHDFEGVAKRYGLIFCWNQLPDNNPGCYIKEQRKIILNSRIRLFERQIFTFGHELMHDRIEYDDDLLSLLADAYVQSKETMIERLCNVGAAELLMPSDDMQDMLREHGFSTGTIPMLCQRYTASSIAVAFQMIFTATHHCYLVIAEPANIIPKNDFSLLMSTPPAPAQTRLVMIYTAASPVANYSIKSGQILPGHHPIYAALQRELEPVSCRANIPFASGRDWEVDSDALYFRGKVFSFFNVSHPASKDQLPLF